MRRPPIRARALALLGDAVTTDHISPAGVIRADSAGRWLIAKGVPVTEFSSYGARRGNHEVMVRGTFANIRLRNRLTPGTEGGVTLHLPDQKQMSIYDAAMRYQAEGIPLVVLAGKQYGSGLTGRERFDILGLAAVDGADSGRFPQELVVKADDLTFRVRVRIDTRAAAEYFRHGGTLPFVLRQRLGGA